METLKKNETLLREDYTSHLKSCYYELNEKVETKILSTSFS